MQTEQQVTFDRYRLDLAREQLWCGSQEIPLPGKAFAMLHYLVEHAGQLVSKAELFAALWPGTAVTDGALTFCIVELRRALGDKATAPRFIETVHRRGYRFIEKVVSSQHSVGSSQNEANQKAKGKNQKAKVEDLPPAPSPQHPAPMLVGRETELAQLHSWLDKALNGARQIVFVTGEPGIGKTTLIDAFLFGVRSREEFGVQEQEESQKSKRKSQKSKVEASPLAPVFLAHGQCIKQYGPGEPYMPILEALGRLCREPDGERLITVLRQHAPTWLVQMPALLGTDEFAALQRELQGTTHERMLREMSEGIEIMTQQRPLILLLEDLHWCDYSTLALVAALARRLERARFLLIGTYRSSDLLSPDHPLKSGIQELRIHDLCTELALPPLSQDDIATYLRNRFAGRALPPTLPHVLYRRTEGHLFFLVTVVDDLVTQGLLVQTEQHVLVHGDIDAIVRQIPDSIRLLLTHQADRLLPLECRVLEAASVIGAEFATAALAVALEIDSEEVEEWCAGLAARQLFLRPAGFSEWPDGTASERYRFVHALYQQLWHERTGMIRRQRLHYRIAERHEVAYRNRTEEIAAELAVHFEQARDEVFIHQFSDNVPAVRAEVEVLLALAREHGFQHWELAAHGLRGWALAREGESVVGLGLMREGSGVRQNMGSNLRMPYHHARMAELYGQAERPDEGLNQLEKALSIVTTTGERWWEAEIYRLKGTLTLQKGARGWELGAGEEESQKSKGKSQKSKITDPRPLTPDPHAEAEACFHKAIEVSRHQQAKSLELRATMSLACLWQQQGKRREAHTMLSDIYNWFTEGFDTKDLQEAKALLTTLS